MHVLMKLRSKCDLEVGDRVLLLLTTAALSAPLRARNTSSSRGRPNSRPTEITGARGYSATSPKPAAASRCSSNSRRSSAVASRPAVAAHCSSNNEHRLHRSSASRPAAACSSSSSRAAGVIVPRHPNRQRPLAADVLIAASRPAAPGGSLQQQPASLT